MLIAKSNIKELFHTTLAAMNQQVREVGIVNFRLPILIFRTMQIHCSVPADSWNTSTNVHLECSSQIYVRRENTMRT